MIRALFYMLDFVRFFGIYYVSSFTVYCRFVEKIGNNRHGVSVEVWLFSSLTVRYTIDFLWEAAPLPRSQGVLRISYAVACDTLIFSQS